MSAKCRFSMFGYFIATAVTLILAGCGDSEPTQYRVTGIVYFKGKPVPYGSVSFFGPGGAPVTSATIDSNGRYRLEAMAGEHAVAVVALPPVQSERNASRYEGGISPTARRASGPSVPAVYGNFATSGLTCVVKSSDENVCDIRIE